MEGGELPQYKALLQTFCQRMRLPLPVYKEVGSEGPEHRKLYQMAVTLNRLPFDEVPAEITFESSSPFPTKRMAEEDAAGAALEAIAEYEEKAKVSASGKRKASPSKEKDSESAPNKRRRSSQSEIQNESNVTGEKEKESGSEEKKEGAKDAKKAKKDGLLLEIESYFGAHDPKSKHKKKKKKAKDPFLPMSLWKCLRGQCFEKAGHRCEVCGDAPPVNRLVCHQVWLNDEKEHVAYFSHFEALCWACHDVKHYSWANREGRSQAAKEHLAKLNKWENVAEAERYIDSCFAQVAELTKHKWKTDHENFWAEVERSGWLGNKDLIEFGPVCLKRKPKYNNHPHPKEG